MSVKRMSVVICEVMWSAAVSEWNTIAHILKVH